MSDYFLPLTTLAGADTAPLAGGETAFRFARHLTRQGAREDVHWRDLPTQVLTALTSPREMIAGVSMDRCRIMGILNVTPDSFSDGGRFIDTSSALAQAQGLAAACDFLDIGGESTRPGADFVPVEQELARVLPVIAASAPLGLPISIDTRKAEVARQALSAGADLVNDVSALCFDPEMARVVATSGKPVCLMHAQGDPKTMQAAPAYDDVVLDVYDWLEGQIALAEAAGIARHNLIADPGIGFGKSISHNLALLRHIAIFHGLGVPLLVGASRKRFIGVIGDAPEPAERLPGSLAVALHLAQQGVQIVRVHDGAPTRQALALQRAVMTGESGT